MKRRKKNTVTVNKGVSSHINAIYKDSSGSLVVKGNGKNIEQVINLPNTINAPIEKGQVLGEVSYILDGKQLGKTDIVAEESVKKISPTNMMEKIFFSWLRVLR